MSCKLRNPDIRGILPRDPAHIFWWREVRRIFWDLKFWLKEIFWWSMNWKTPGFFGSPKKHRDFFVYCFFSSTQINNNINAIYCWCGIFFVDMLGKVGIFWGRQILKLGFFWVWNMNLCRTLTPPPPPPSIIKISVYVWGPWPSDTVLW